MNTGKENTPGAAGKENIVLCTCSLYINVRVLSQPFLALKLKVKFLKFSSTPVHQVGTQKATLSGMISTR